MPLSGSRLQGVLDPEILAQLLLITPINPDLQPEEQAAAELGRQKLATALATAIGPKVVLEITGNALVPIGIAGSVTSGLGVGGATITTAPGTVT